MLGIVTAVISTSYIVYKKHLVEGDDVRKHSFEPELCVYGLLILRKVGKADKVDLRA